MRIAMLGTRGVPASYSGFETCVEQLGSRLVQRGHKVTVYCRSHHVHHAEPVYKGMRLVSLPAVKNKYLDTIVHSFISSLHAVTQSYDIALYFIAGNSLVTWIPRLAGQVTVLNVDGLDWRRQKWPILAKRYIQFAERMSRVLPSAIITDSREVQRYYKRVYQAESTYIAYGSDVPLRPAGEHLARLGLRPQGYVLFVGRLVPENCVHHLVEAFAGLDTDLTCVVVGDAAYAQDYIEQLKAGAGPNVLFAGYLFGEGYHELGSNARLFVETSEVGGTHPALIEAMAFGNCVVVNGTPENRETIGDAGFAYDGASGAAALRPLLQKISGDTQLLAETGRRAKERAAALYSWDAVTDRYEDLFAELLRHKTPRRHHSP